MAELTMPRPRGGAKDPRYRLIIVLDAAGSTKLSNHGRLALRDVIYDCMQQALKAVGVPDRYVEKLVDRGDGLICLIHAVDVVPKPLLLDELVPELNRLLSLHNADHPKQAARVRISINAGDVHKDGRGWSGADLDLTCRLLDAKKFKAYHAENNEPTAVVVTESFYKTIDQQGNADVSPVEFTAKVRVPFADGYGRGCMGTVRNGPR